MVTNGHLRPEGEQGSPLHSAVLRNPESHLVIDLGKAREIRAMVFQFDADDRYVIAASVDGNHWEGIVNVEAGPAGAGLRARHVVFPEPVVVRFFAVHAEGGDGRFHVAQVQAYSEVPTPWPPVLTPTETSGAFPPPRPSTDGAALETAQDRSRAPSADRPPGTPISVLIGAFSAAAVLLLGWRLFLREQRRGG